MVYDSMVYDATVYDAMAFDTMCFNTMALTLKLMLKYPLKRKLTLEKKFQLKQENQL